MPKKAKTKIKGSLTLEVRFKKALKNYRSFVKELKLIAKKLKVIYDQTKKED